MYFHQFLQGKKGRNIDTFLGLNQPEAKPSTPTPFFVGLRRKNLQILGFQYF